MAMTFTGAIASRSWITEDATASTRVAFLKAGTWFGAKAGKLYFRDGSFWVLGVVSAGTEPDAGTMYSTVMQDTNGNQILGDTDKGRG